MNISNFVGNTPIIKLSKKLNPYVNINIYIKLEYYNPSGSIKDRMVNYILKKCMEDGTINSNTTIIEASSGNTGSSLAMFSSLYNLKLIICTNTKCSNEKINMIKSFNPELIITNSCPSNSIEHYQNVAKKIADSNPEYYHFNQYDNYLNSESYYKTLGPEILNTIKNVDYFTCGGSTCGTITGVGRYLKDNNNDVKIILADVNGSILHNFIKNKSTNPNPGTTNIEGIGKDSIPKNMDVSIIDDTIIVSDNDAIDMCYKLAKHEGIFSGGSGGCNVFSAIKLAEKINNNKDNDNIINIVTVIPDSGFKYISKIYNPEWLKSIDININD